MPDKQDLEPLLNTQQSQLDLVLSDAASIDNKALAILASNVALLLFIAQAGFDLSQWWQFALLLGPFAVSLILDCLAIWPQQYLGPIVNLEQHPEYLSLPRRALLLQLLADARKAVKHNLQLNKRRWHFCAASMAFTTLGTVLLFMLY